MDLDAELASLAIMTWPELRERWVVVTRRPAPRVKHALLRMALAFEVQASVYGGLTKRTAGRLEQMSAALPQRSRRRCQSNEERSPFGRLLPETQVV